MDDIGESTFRLNLTDVKAFIGLLEKNEGPNRFSKAIERKLVEEFVENDWEIKRSPVPGFETNLEYLFSLIPELYSVTQKLSENAEEFASSLVNLLHSYQIKNTLPIHPKKVLH